MSQFDDDIDRLYTYPEIGRVDYSVDWDDNLFRVEVLYYDDRDIDEYIIRSLKEYNKFSELTKTK